MPDVAAGSVGNSLLNFIFGQQSDPAQQMSDWANTQQARNRTAAGMDLQGNILPPPAPGAQPGVGAGQITGPPQDPTAAMAAVQKTGMLPQGQEPNATKTPQSMGSMIIDLQRRQEAEAGLNTALGGIGAAISRPENRERSSRMFTGGQGQMGDPLKLGQGLMDLASQTQGQDRMNAIGQMIYDPQRGPALAKSLNNMSWEALKSAFQTNPAGIAQMVSSYYTPTDTIKNLRDVTAMGGGSGSSTLGDVKTSIVSGVAGPEAQPMISAQDAWRVAHPNRPDSEMGWKPNDLASFKQYTVDENQKSGDRQTASNELVDKNETTMRLQSDLETLKDSPGLKSILNTPGKRAIAQKVLNDPNQNDAITILANNAGLTSPEADAIALLKRVGGATTESAMKGMAGTGTRVTQMEVGPLKDAITTTQNLNQSYESYIHGAINSAITRAKRAVAANYGNTGNVSNLPPEYAPWLNDAFKKGGQLYKEGSGTDALSTAEPVPASEIADGKELLAAKPYLRDEMLDNWQQRGFDTSKLRGKNPTKW